MDPREQHEQPKLLTDTAPPPGTPIRRIISHQLKKAGRGDLFVEAMEKKMRYDAYLALMVWDAITTGQMYFADGTIMKISEFKEWLDLVKFVSVHLDGPAVIENKFQGINIFKIYNNIDESKV
jgi:hypothetical protein